MTTAILERLDQAILDVIDSPETTQKTTAIGTLFRQTLYHDRFCLARLRTIKSEPEMIDTIRA